MFLLFVALASHSFHDGAPQAEGASDNQAPAAMDPTGPDDPTNEGVDLRVETPPLNGPWGAPPPAEPAPPGGSDPAHEPDRDFHPPFGGISEAPAPGGTPRPTSTGDLDGTPSQPVSGEPADVAADVTPVDLEPTTPPPANSDVDVASVPLRWAPRLLPFDGPASFIVTATAGIVLLGLSIGTGNASSVPQVVRVRPFQRGRKLALAAAPRMPETALGLLGEAHHYGVVVRCHARAGEAKVSMRRNPRVPCEEVEGYLVGLFEAVWGRDIDIRHPECLDHTHSETCEYQLRAVVRREVKTSSSYVPLRPDA